MFCKLAYNGYQYKFRSGVVEIPVMVCIAKQKCKTNFILFLLLMIIKRYRCYVTRILLS